MVPISMDFFADGRGMYWNNDYRKNKRVKEMGWDTTLRKGKRVTEKYWEGRGPPH